MRVDFSQDYYELFALERGPRVETAPLAERYRELQRVLHPDRFASRPDAERRWSVQASSFVNEAYRTLTDPLARATYLLSLHGIDTDTETDTRMEAAFLMEQMEYRESLEEAERAAEPLDALDRLRARLAERCAAIEAEFVKAADDADWAAAREQVRRWQFFDRLGREATAVEARLDA